MKNLLILFILLASCAKSQQRVCCTVINTNNVIPVQSGLITDFNFTNPASVTTSSGKVASITDAIGGVVSSQSTSGSRPTYNSSYATFSGSQYLTGALLSTSSSFSGFAVMRVSGSQGINDNAGVFQNGFNANGYGINIMNSNNTFIVFPNVGTGGGVYNMTDTGRWQIVAFTHSPGVNKLYNTVGHKVLGESGNNPNTPTTSHYIGLVAGTNFFKGDIKRILLYNTILSDSQMQTMCQYLQGLYSLPLPIFYVHDGDSISAGTDAVANLQAYPTQAFQQLRDSVYMYFYNAAVPGYTSQNVLDSLQGQVLNQYRPGVKNIFALMIGHNDGLLNSINTQIAILQATHNAGFINIICTQFNSYQSAVQTATVAYNNYVKANYKTTMYCDTVADMNNAPNLTDPTNTTYFDSDGVHLKAAGATAAATYFKQYIYYYATH